MYSEFKPMQILFSFIASVLFGLGLAISGMLNPAKVIGFLDITGEWDPSLAFVMGGALVVTVFSFRWVLRRPMPISSDMFHLPTKRNLDGRLITGAAIFGIGWAVSGLCPGPAIASVGFLNENLLIFVLALIIGSLLANVHFPVGNNSTPHRLGGKS
jgi:uncharacterized membrane protein YedE/YeeE